MIVFTLYFAGLYISVFFGWCFAVFAWIGSFFGVTLMVCLVVLLALGVVSYRIFSGFWFLGIGMGSNQFQCRAQSRCERGLCHGQQALPF